MLDTVKKLCKDCVTGVDNDSYHIAKISWVLALIVYTIVIIYNMYHHNQMSLAEIGAGFGAISGSHSLTIMGMRRDDPGNKE